MSSPDDGGDVQLPSSRLPLAAAGVVLATLVWAAWRRGALTALWGHAPPWAGPLASRAAAALEWLSVHALVALSALTALVLRRRGEGGAQQQPRAYSSDPSPSTKSRRLARDGLMTASALELAAQGGGGDGDDDEAVDERSPLTRSAPEPPPPPPPPPLPRLLGVEPGEQPLLAPAEQRALLPHLPARLGGYDWLRLFHTSSDGYSLQTLYSRAQHCGPTLLLVLSDAGALCAAFASRDWSGSDPVLAGGPAARLRGSGGGGGGGAGGGRLASPGGGGGSAYHLAATGALHAGAAGGSAYFGSGECFVAQLRPAATVYRWSRANNYFQLARADCLAFGGGSVASSSLSSGGGSGGGGGGALLLGAAPLGAPTSAGGALDGGASAQLRSGGGGGAGPLARGGFALWLDANLEWGYSGPCMTFNTLDSLVAVAPGGSGGGATAPGIDGGRFRIVRVEVWGFTPPAASGTRMLRQQQAANSQLHVQGVSAAALPRTASSASLAPAAGGTRASEERRWA